MIDSVDNPDWDKVASLRPQLRQHMHCHPQDFRGLRWYILRDELSGRYLRLNSTAYDFIARLDGKRRVDDIRTELGTRDNAQVLSQDESILLLTKLFAIDALRNNVTADAREYFKRYQREHQQRIKRAVMNPLAIRIPLLDPDRILNWMMPWVRPLLSTAGAVVWFVTVVFSMLVGLLNFPEIQHEFSNDILAPENLGLIIVIYVVIKGMHEFAHAFAVKKWGGEVHEMGITLLVLAPIPYVDASAAWVFRDKYKRAFVGAIGVLTELLMASIALLVWLAVEPGLVRDIAFDAFLLGSVSTLLFNANPLLRYDGYYVMQDLVEIPNLYSRSSSYYLYLIQHYLFGLTQTPSPAHARGEALWFAIYGLATFFYRIFILVFIVLFLSEEYLFLGVALGLWAIFMQILRPLSRGLGFLVKDPRLSGKRGRAVTASGIVIGGLAAALTLIPVTLSTFAEGVVWVEDQAQIYSPENGFVEEVLVSSGEPVTAGTPLLRLRAPDLQTRIIVLKARYQELQTQIAAQRIENRVQSAISAEQQQLVTAELSMLETQVNSLLVHSEVDGIFVLPDEYAAQGRYMKKGELLGYIINPDRMRVTTVLPQSDIGLLRRQVSQVDVRLAERPEEIVAAKIVRQTPAATDSLPNPLLGMAGGGRIAVHANGGGTTIASEKMFKVELSLPGKPSTAGIGGRAYVRFDHGTEVLAAQWLRRGEQLLLKRLNM